MKTILKKHKNALFNTLEKSGIDIKLFDYEENKEETFKSLKIIYRDTPFYFLIRNSDADFDGFDYSFVKFNAKYSRPPFGITVKIDEVCRNLTLWITNHVKVYINELTEIDLWEQLKSSDKILDVNKIDFDSKDNFNYDEQKQIELAVNDLKLLIAKNFTLVEDEIKAVNARLDYLAEAVKRLNKFDWQGLLMNTIVSTGTALSLNNEQGRQLLLLFKQAFSIVTKYFLG